MPLKMPIIAYAIATSLFSPHSFTVSPESKPIEAYHTTSPVNALNNKTPEWISWQTYYSGFNLLSPKTDIGPCDTASEWVSATAYAGGSYVKYNGKLFRARNWTQGDTPRGFGIWPDGPWEDLGYC
ncbi:carbohydrate-binding protein [Chitinophaga pinensis]|uniref:Carbohydrate-binding family V/XII n=1 Tax=Chitinophaga pinensis (strain ATCC 43595 / DSM 2588 / LMG 13176 / NBRC 15968 / NCIMB 11800 / UQM 2034) TaxID=485918 RepID=A0A979G5H5_CHIPD|nr:carbohydrate-binding protein [Chitinophaga pinensis]ACU61254.1 Carbohydrate-binding family V/XII [Chitinophaga pinensis DSM 2588]